MSNKQQSQSDSEALSKHLSVQSGSRKDKKFIIINVEKDGEATSRSNEMKQNSDLGSSDQPVLEVMSARVFKKKHPKQRGGSNGSGGQKDSSSSGKNSIETHKSPVNLTSSSQQSKSIVKDELQTVTFDGRHEYSFSMIQDGQLTSSFKQKVHEDSRNLSGQQVSSIQKNKRDLRALTRSVDPLEYSKLLKTEGNEGQKQARRIKNPSIGLSEYGADESHHVEANNKVRRADNKTDGGTISNNSLSIEGNGNKVFKKRSNVSSRKYKENCNSPKHQNQRLIDLFNKMNAKIEETQQDMETISLMNRFKSLMKIRKLQLQFEEQQALAQIESRVGFQIYKNMTAGDVLETSGNNTNLQKSVMITEVEEKSKQSRFSVTKTLTSQSTQFDMRTFKRSHYVNFDKIETNQDKSKFYQNLKHKNLKDKLKNKLGEEKPLTREELVHKSNSDFRKRLSQRFQTQQKDRVNYHLYLLNRNNAIEDPKKKNIYKDQAVDNGSQSMIIIDSAAVTSNQCTSPVRFNDINSPNISQKNKIVQASGGDAIPGDSECSDSDKSNQTSDFDSDDSYYDEDDLNELLCINQKQIQDRKMLKLSQADVKPNKRQYNQNIIEQDAKNLHFFLDIGEKLNVPKILDRDVAQLAEFMTTLPIFQNKFNILAKNQIRSCLEKMKIKICERSSILYRQGDPQKFTYIILSGIINFYDENLPLQNSFQQCDSRKCASLLDREANIKKVFSKGIGELNRSAKEKVDNESPGQTGKGLQTKESLQCLQTVQVISRDETTDLNVINVDDTTYKLMVIQCQKIKALQAGSQFGHSQDCVDHQTKQMLNSAICKTDCIILELKHDIFEILIRQQIRLQNEFITSHILRTFPKMLKFYTPLRVSENAQEVCKMEEFKKGQYIQQQGSVINERSKLYMVVEGRINISRFIQFLDENENLKKKDEIIMEIAPGDIIGEEFIWFNRLPSYSARVLKNAKVLAVENRDFLKYFGRVIPATLKMLETRYQFVEERFQKLMVQNEYKCLEFNTKIGSQVSYNWDISQSKSFYDSNNSMVNKKMKDRYIRSDHLQKQKPPQKILLQAEIVKQKKETQEKLAMSPVKKGDFEIISKQFRQTQKQHGKSTNPYDSMGQSQMSSQWFDISQNENSKDTMGRQSIIQFQSMSTEKHNRSLSLNSQGFQNISKMTEKRRKQASNAQYGDNVKRGQASLFKNKEQMQTMKVVKFVQQLPQQVQHRNQLKIAFEDQQSSLYSLKKQPVLQTRQSFESMNSAGFSNRGIVNKQIVKQGKQQYIIDFKQAKYLAPHLEQEQGLKPYEDQEGQDLSAREVGPVQHQSIQVYQEKSNDLYYEHDKHGAKINTLNKHSSYNNTPESDTGRRIDSPKFQVIDSTKNDDGTLEAEVQDLQVDTLEKTGEEYGSIVKELARTNIQVGEYKQVVLSRQEKVVTNLTSSTIHTTKTPIQENRPMTMETQKLSNKKNDNQLSNVSTIDVNAEAERNSMLDSSVNQDFIRNPFIVSTIFQQNKPPDMSRTRQKYTAQFPSAHGSNQGQEMLRSQENIKNEAMGSKILELGLEQEKFLKSMSYLPNELQIKESDYKAADFEKIKQRQHGKSEIYMNMVPQTTSISTQNMRAQSTGIQFDQQKMQQSGDKWHSTEDFQELKQTQVDIDMEKFAKKFHNKAKQNTAGKRLMHIRKFQPDYGDEQNFLVQKIIMRKGLAHHTRQRKFNDVVRQKSSQVSTSQGQSTKEMEPYKSSLGSNYNYLQHTSAGKIGTGQTSLPSTSKKISVIFKNKQATDDLPDIIEPSLQMRQMTIKRSDEMHKKYEHEENDIQAILNQYESHESQANNTLYNKTLNNFDLKPVSENSTYTNDHMHLINQQRHIKKGSNLETVFQNQDVSSETTRLNNKSHNSVEATPMRSFRATQEQKQLMRSSAQNFIQGQNSDTSVPDKNGQYTINMQLKVSRQGTAGPPQQQNHIRKTAGTDNLFFQKRLSFPYMNHQGAGDTYYTTDSSGMHPSQQRHGMKMSLQSGLVTAAGQRDRSHGPLEQQRSSTNQIQLRSNFIGIRKSTSHLGQRSHLAPNRSFGPSQNSNFQINGQAKWQDRMRPAKLPYRDADPYSSTADNESLTKSTFNHYQVGKGMGIQIEHQNTKVVNQKHLPPVQNVTGSDVTKINLGDGGLGMAAQTNSPQKPKLDPSQGFSVIFIPAKNQSAAEIQTALLKNPSILLSAQGSESVPVEGNTKLWNQLPQSLSSLLLKESLKNKQGMNPSSSLSKDNNGNDSGTFNVWKPSPRQPLNEATNTKSTGKFGVVGGLQNNCSLTFSNDQIGFLHQINTSDKEIKMDYVQPLTEGAVLMAEREASFLEAHEQPLPFILNPKPIPIVMQNSGTSMM